MADHPSRLSDDDLVHRVRQLVCASNEVTADLVVHLGEVDIRKLFADQAYSSMFAWCVGELGLSEKATYKRITAARHARRFPRLAEELSRGMLHLSGIVLIGPHLTDANADELIEAVRGKSCQRIEQYLADRSPRPAPPARIRKLPAPARPTSPAPAAPPPAAPPPAAMAPAPPTAPTTDPPAAPAGPAPRQQPQDRIEPLGAARPEGGPVQGAVHRQPGAGRQAEASPGPAQPQDSGRRPHPGARSGPHPAQRVSAEEAIRAALRRRHRQLRTSGDHHRAGRLHSAGRFHPTGCIPSRRFHHLLRPFPPHSQRHQARGCRPRRPALRIRRRRRTPLRGDPLPGVPPPTPLGTPSPPPRR